MGDWRHGLLSGERREKERPRSWHRAMVWRAAMGGGRQHSKLQADEGPASDLRQDESGLRLCNRQFSRATFLALEMSKCISVTPGIHVKTHRRTPRPRAAHVTVVPSKPTDPWYNVSVITFFPTTIYPIKFSQIFLLFPP